LEVLWTVIPVLILLVIAVPSFRLLYYLDKQIEPDMTVKVTGVQWYWNYEYPDQNLGFDSYMINDEDLQPGQKRLLDVDNPLVLPEGSKVKVLIAGNDVMHSFFVPSLAVQEYSVPGKLNEVWMDIPLGEKTYYGQCNQICGINHSYMPVVIQVLSKENYKDWLNKAKIEFALAEPSFKENLILAEVKN
jgi:cytochrome c oxidase subunit 2